MYRIGQYTFKTRPSRERNEPESAMIEEATTLPRREARRRAFLEAASAVFLEKGYAAATLDDVIARSGGSRQTLYALFGGKEGLFQAIVAERSAAIFEAFPADASHGRAPEEVLTELGIRYLEIVTTPEALGMYRLVVAEGAARPELAEQFWNSGPANARTQIGRYLAEQHRRGTLEVADPPGAAGEFWGLLLGLLHLECLLGLRAKPGRAELESHVRKAVACFLDGYRRGA
jgi:TetR/AcrR family transcriptional regulator, mexJK operon transcriptional repressor